MHSKIISATLTISCACILLSCKTNTPDIVNVNTNASNSVSTSNGTTNAQLLNNESIGKSINGEVEFYYPTQFPAQYVTPADWPPTVEIHNQAYSCGKNVVREQGTTVSEKIRKDKKFCLIKTVEGTAGSAYTTYEYTTAFSAQSSIVYTLTLQAPQCENYDEPEQTVCNNEQKTLDVDAMIVRMHRTIESTK